MAFEFCDLAELTAAEKATLEQGDTAWTVNDSPFVNYGLPLINRVGFNAESLLPRFMDQISSNPPGIVLDLAGGNNARALKDLIDLGLASAGLVTNYQDLRSEETVLNPNISQITKDLTNKDTWQEIEDWRNLHAPLGFSAILHRPVGALQKFEKRVYAGALNTLVDWTAPNGACLLQVPMALVEGGVGMICNNVRRRPDVSDVIRTNDRQSVLIIK